MSYVEGGSPVLESRNESIRIFDRNAMSWLDDRCAAAYITAKDPAVLSFAKNVTGSVKDAMNPAVDRNLQVSFALHEALDLHGLKYLVDPTSSYASTSKDREVVDFLQFPRQTLEYRAGDCDDLSILYAALLESVGIETAFITVPGHIFLALALASSPDEARKAFSRPDELIMRGEKAWLPVETTDRSGGFFAAWQTGAKEWRESLARGQAGFFPVHEAWTVFEPVGLPGSGAAINPPASGILLARFGSELSRFVEREIASQVSRLQAEVQRGGKAAKAVNALGVLYAKYGLYDKAGQQFEAILAKAEYVPALINLGTIQYRAKNLEKAQAWFERAYKAEPTNPLSILYLARVNHDAENYGLVRKLYAELVKQSPGLASQFAYLDLKGEESARAANIAQVKEIMVWAE